MVCSALATLLIVQESAEASASVLNSFYANQAFFRGVQEMIIESDSDTLHHNALVLTLAQFCLSTQQRDPSMVPLAQLNELSRSVTDDVNIT